MKSEDEASDMPAAQTQKTPFELQVPLAEVELDQVTGGLLLPPPPVNVKGATRIIRD
ncbi:hypothetical protein GCM10007301_37950 [Azorhizobium oxalatiphilum]|uniref:Uncharacterized protein n=1 Tax=Azorhizobium oxalatiphilum TaxID=980631 RepID=A0A917C7R7_9HYPH|nr:hypothetical protein GCM10007301_37950 [Azorhizobium oxalatiphilum]